MPLTTKAKEAINICYLFLNGLFMGHF